MFASGIFFACISIFFSFLKHVVKEEWDGGNFFLLLIYITDGFFVMLAQLFLVLSESSPALRNDLCSLPVCCTAQLKSFSALPSFKIRVDSVNASAVYPIKAIPHSSNLCWFYYDKE